MEFENDNQYNASRKSSFGRFKKISSSSDWFEIYEVTPRHFVFYEPYHFEESISNLVIGDDLAVLIDTGCGIGNLRKAVKEITSKPIQVVNTHSHTDHIGSNCQFENVTMFDHPLSRKISKNGVPQEVMSVEIFQENLIRKPLPDKFNPKDHFLPPFHVQCWLREGDQIDLGNTILEVIHTPGEAPDHICLLDKTARILFSGDILLKGAIWTHIDGGSIAELRNSYLKLLKYFDHFDHIMPSHNETMLDKNLVKNSLQAVDSILSGNSFSQTITDPWGKKLEKYSFESFSILTRSEN